MWSFQHPFYQFELPFHVLRNLDRLGSSASIDALMELNTKDLSTMLGPRLGPEVGRCRDNFPGLHVETEIAPLNKNVLRVHLAISADFRWNDKVHGGSEPFWIWVEDSDTAAIYHHEYLILNRKTMQHQREMHFTIPLSGMQQSDATNPLLCSYSSKLHAC